MEADNNKKKKKKKQQQKLRVLCLHGYRTSAAILKHELLQKWGNSTVLELLEMTFLDGPLPCRGKSAVDGYFPPPYYEWFKPDAVNNLEELENCIHYIVTFMYKNGPFHGLLGFSQGGLVASTLVGLQNQGLVLMQHPPIQFTIVLCGTSLWFMAWKETCFSKIIKSPSLHFIGNQDPYKLESEYLLQVFKHPIIIRHNNKHVIPRLNEEATIKVLAFLENIQENVVPLVIGMNEMHQREPIFTCQHQQGARL